MPISLVNDGIQSNSKITCYVGTIESDDKKASYATVVKEDGVYCDLVFYGDDCWEPYAEFDAVETSELSLEEVLDFTKAVFGRSIE